MLLQSVQTEFSLNHVCRSLSWIDRKMEKQQVISIEISVPIAKMSFLDTVQNFTLLNLFILFYFVVSLNHFH